MVAFRVEKIGKKRLPENILILRTTRVLDILCFGPRQLSVRYDKLNEAMALGFPGGGFRFDG